MPSSRRAAAPALLGVIAVLGGLAGVPARAADPIRIGVIAEASSIAGAAIPNGAQVAADEINAAGGIGGRRIELVTYDDHNSSTDAVRALQRLVNEDHVQAVIASYVSEIVLALSPWANRLHVPMLTPGAASDQISEQVHADYERTKYTFHAYLTSAALARSVCDSARDALVGALHLHTAAIMSEDAAWTGPLDAGYAECLPTIGLQVVDHVRFSPDTGDFTPIYNAIEAKHPDLIVTGIAHVGVQPTVQWAQKQVPVPMAGISAQATSGTFWKSTNGAANGVLFQNLVAPGVASTPKTNPFTDAYTKRFGITPAYCGYTAADDVHIIAEAVARAGSTDGAKLVTALEATDYEGTVGRTQFYGREDRFTHSMRYGPGLVTGLLMQWQAGADGTGRLVALWPASVASGRIAFPAFVKGMHPGG